MNNDTKIKAAILLIIFLPIFLSASNELMPAIAVQTYWIFGSMAAFIAFAYLYNPVSQLGLRIKLGVFLIILASLIFSLLLGQLPANLNAQETQYMEHFNAGYKCFQDDDYDCSLREYELAENIFDTDVALYVRKAWTYQYLQQYDKAIEAAKKGLQLDESQSIYKKAHRYGRGILNSDISLYTTLGKCHFYLKQYQEAKEAFSYVINHTTYKYSNDYLWRGICEYYLGEKQNALSDFYKHKQIVLQYMQDQAESEYKAAYPTYDQKDLKDTEGWIKMTLAL